MPSSRREQVLRLLSHTWFVMLLVLLAEVVVFTALSSSFLTSENLRNVLVQSVFILLIAVGITFVLLTGGIDLSVGTVLGLCAGVSVLVLISGGSALLAVVAALAVGVAFGFVNGFIVAKLKINDFIVTLGTLSVAAGALRLLDAHRPLRGVESGTFEALARSSVLGIPLPVIIGGAVVLALDFVLRRTAFGRAIFAVGINPDAAHLAGIRVDRVRLGVFVVSGAVAGLSGVLLASRLGAVPAGLGRGFELDAIAAAVLGGTSLAGGRGTVFGTVVGALILASLRNGLQLGGVDTAWYTVIVGLTIVGAVALDERVRKAVFARLSRTRRASGAPPAAHELRVSHTEVR